MTRRFYECQFPNSSRLYCYHWDGEPLAKGDKVDVMTDRGELTVAVVAEREQPPSFATKAIIGKVKPLADGAP